MKWILTPLLFVSTINLHAQCVVTDLGLDSALVSACAMDARIDGSGVLACVQPYVPLWGQPQYSTRSRELVLYRLDATGQIQWSRLISPTNPANYFRATGVKQTQDGGLIAFGDIDHSNGFWIGTYQNQFVIKLDAAGCTEWARIYQVHDSIGYYNEEELEDDLLELTGGGYLMTLTSSESLYSIHLDADGVPGSIQAYVWPLGRHCSAFLGTGEFYTAAWRATFGGFVAFHVDASGQLVWSKELASAIVQVPQRMTRTANGDLLVCASGHSQDDVNTGTFLTRLDQAGAVLWASYYDHSCWTDSVTQAMDIVELSNGDLLLARDSLMIRMDPAGVVSAAWSTGFGRIGGLSLRNDSLIIQEGTYYFPLGDPDVRVVIVPDLSDLSCAFAPTVLPTRSAVVLNPSPIAMSTDTSSVKTWTLALTPTCGDELSISSDLVASVHYGAPVRPGTHTHLYGTVSNAALVPSGLMEITCTVPSALSVGVVAPTPSSVVGNVITWSGVPALGHLAHHVFDIEVNVPPDPLLIGTPIAATIEVAQDSAEVALVNNTYTLNQTIVGAYDPNDKLVRTSSGLNDAEFYPGIDEWLDYTIRFQNTGTDTAFNVVVTDTLPAELSTGTLNLLSASHPYTYEFGGDGILRFTFANILLPDSNVNEPLSHGLVSFRIKPDNGLALGTVITNRADIFFDFNPAVRTPDAVVTISMPTALPELHSNDLLIYPVPVREVLVAQLPEGFAVRRVDVLSADGRLVRSPNIDPLNGRLDVGMQGLLPGLYALSVEGAEGQRLAARFVKE